MKTNGHRHSLIEEMGEERFMEEGKRLLEERMKDVPANLNPKD